MATLHRLFTIAAVLLVSTAKSQENQEYDTIVVGLGAAGTVAASILAREGKKVLGLEALERVGGRVCTVPFGDGVVEIGAEWLHGSEHSVPYEAAKKYNVITPADDLHYTTIRSDGRWAGTVVDEILDYAFSFHEEKPDKVCPLGDFFTTKLTEYIKEKKPEVFEDKVLLKNLMDFSRQRLVNMWAAYDSNDINALDSYVSLGGLQASSWHRNGYKTFFDIMLNKYNNGPGLPTLFVKLSTEVTKIEWPQEAVGKVSVTTKDGTIYKADNVIVTISIGVLKERYKTLFSPSLPQKKEIAINKIQMGLIGKIILSFPRAWWPSKDVMYGLLWNDEDVKKVSSEDQWTTKLNEVSPSMGSSNTLTVWTSGDVTKQVEKLPEDVVKTKTVEILRRFIGANTTVPEPTGIIRTKWFSNRFARGTYSYEDIKASDVPSARSDLAEPLVDAAGKPCVLFAGEASHPTVYSTVHGAADTGRREALRILGREYITLS